MAGYRWFRPRAGRPARRWLAAVVAVVLTAAGIQAANTASALAAVKAGEPGPVSNAFAMGGGVGGSVDQRTGAFQASVPLLNVAGRAGAGLSLALSYDQSLAAQNVDRFGFGAGWSLGVPWIDTAGGIRVYPASGGSYEYDASAPTGLADYPLRDLSFKKESGVIPARPGRPEAQPYAYTLTDRNGGTVDRFDANGNLVEQVDPFGNAIDITWRQSGHSWQPTSVVDNYGQVTRFDYSTPGQVQVISPVNAEKITATTTLEIDKGLLVRVTDPLHQVTSFGYSSVDGLTAGLLDSVTSPTGEHTSISYTRVAYETTPVVVVVNDVTVTNADRTKVLPTLHFDIDPRDNPNQHNYTGYPDHNNGTGTDGLFNSGDFGYRYSTELSNGTSSVVATYNSLHLLVEQKVFTRDPGGPLVQTQDQTYKYPDVTSVADLPPNYAKPTLVTVTYGNPQFPTRTARTSSDYNDRGLLVSAVNAAGMATKDTYFGNGLLDTQTQTGPDGTTSITTDTLTADGKSVKTVSTATGASAADATARTVASYGYNDHGQVTSESVAWAPGAKPPGPSGGPDQVDDTEQISVDTAAHTQTDVVTAAAGTPQAAATTTVTDLVTGNVLSQTSPDHLTTSYTYDALGRELTQVAPGNLTTTTAYNSPTETTVTAPSGLQTRTTTDVLGRTLKVTDNVSGQKLVANPAARTLQTDSYSTDGTTLTTTTPGGTTTTNLDPLGRPLSIVHPGGITQTDTYNDAANTQTVKLLPAGSGSPVSVTTDSFGHLNQPTGSVTSYPDGTPAAPAAETYDGLGRVASYTANNLTATVNYPGTGGLQTATTLTPRDTATFPGQPVASSTDNTMTGAMTAKTLAEQAKTGQARAAAAAGPATGSTYTYNDAGQVATATDQAGQTTSYTYTPAGQIATVTTPSGAKTTYTYDPVTGRLDRKEVRAPDGATRATVYTYYPDTGRVKSVYDPAHPDDAISYAYDADGHLIAVHYPDGKTTSASYSDDGNLATSTDITGAVTSYTYNAAGTCGPTITNLCRAVQARDGTTLASISYTYDSLDRVHTITRGNGVTTTLAYNDASQIKTETTTAADGTLLRTDRYTYDSHGNVATHTTTSALPAPGRAAPGRASPRVRATASTTTTGYGYDAYNRLISSAVYPGDTTAGTPDTATSYTLNTAGDITGQVTTTGTAKTTTVNTIAGGRLTRRDVNGAVTRQDFDADGNVTKDLSGNSYTYNLAGQIASVTTAKGITTRYTYWPDGTRRAAITTADGVDHTITYHYAPGGKIANDSYTGGGPEVTASYLMAVGREARTLATGTGGTVTAQTSGPGTGYYLTDAHASVTAMIDDHGQVTASYAYGDYGQPAGASPALLPGPAPDPAGNAAVNPFGYDGAYTNPNTGTQYLTARTYDPGQGRFLSLDAADQLNRYQAFNTNPILNTDPTGQLAVPQWLIDGAAAATLIILGVAAAWTGAGELLTAAGVVDAASAVAEASGAAIAQAVLETAAGAANVGAGAISAALTVDDVKSLDGEGFFDETTRQNLETASFALGTAGAVADFGAQVARVAATADNVAAVATALDKRFQEGASTAGPAYGRGFVAGKNAGVAEGGAAGYARGFTAGEASGAETGWQAGYVAGDAEGSKAGQAAGFGMGWEAGMQLGYAGGYQAGTAELMAQAPKLSSEPVPALTDIADQNSAGNTLIEPDAVVNGVPGSPAETGPGTEPTTTTTQTATNTGSVAGALGEEAAVSAQDTLSSNTPTSVPPLPANPTGESVSAPVIGSGITSGFGPQAFNSGF